MSESVNDALNELVNIATILEDNGELELAKGITDAVDTIDENIDS